MFDDSWEIILGYLTTTLTVHCQWDLKNIQYIGGSTAVTCRQLNIMWNIWNVATNTFSLHGNISHIPHTLKLAATQYCADRRMEEAL